VKQAEISRDDLPAPGEPLTPKIHEDNQRLIDAELAERTKRARAKLTRKQLKALNKTYAALHRQLNRAKYNPLIKEREETWQVYKKLVLLLRDPKTRGQEREVAAAALQQIKAKGKKLNDQITALIPAVTEFEMVGERLKAHAAVIEWEKKDAEDKAQFEKEAFVWKEQIKAVMRQSPRLHHAGKDEQGNYFCHIPQIEHIVFKDDRVLYRITTSTQGLIDRWLGRWRNALPYDVDIRDLTCDETLENYSAACNRVVTVERSKSGTNLFYCISRLDAPDGIPKMQLYGKVIDFYPVADHAKTPWAAGTTQDRKVEWYNFEDMPHVLMAGSTKSGKSNHINQMIATFVTMSSPAEIRLMLIDLKGGIEFTHWQGIKHALRPMVKKADDVLEALQFMRSIMERRLMMFEKIKAKNLSSYNSKAKTKLPRLICIVDEMATLLGLGELTTAIHNELRVLSSQGRAVGVHLVLCTQHSSVDVLPGWVKTNMSLRISGKMPSHQASMVILDSVTAATLPNIPGRLVFSIGRSEVQAQSPYISDDEIARAVRLSQAFPDPDNSEFDASQPIEPREKFSQFDVIEMALTDFDGKLSPTHIHDKVGNEVIPLRKLRLMVDTLIDHIDKHGFIEHRDVRYKYRKNRKAYFLETIELPVQQETEGDTEELKPLVSPVEEPA
jgi:hypothetical protein